MHMCFFMVIFYFQVRSCSSGKQRRSRFPSALADKEIFPKMPPLAEERLKSSGKPRSPSPVRRSLSTDRGASLRSKVKADTLENQPISRVPFPARTPVNKSVSTIPAMPSLDNNSKIHLGSQEPAKQDNILDAFYGLQKFSTRKVHQEHEEEQFRQALNIKQGGIRKSKLESKAKAKQQLPSMFQRSDMGVTLQSNMDAGEKMEEPRKSDFSEPESEQILVGSVVNGSLRTNKLRQNYSRNSQNLEPRHAHTFT